MGRRVFRERRLARGEMPEFVAAFALADRVAGWLSRREAEALYVCSSRVSSRDLVVEIGSHVGRSTIVLASAARLNGSRVISVDPHTGDRAFVERYGLSGIDTEPNLRANLAAAGVSESVEVVVTTSEAAAQSWQYGPTIGLLFVDGWHSADAVYADGVAWRSYLNTGAIVAFDDAFEPEVAAGVRRLRRDGHLGAPLGHVGKIEFYGYRGAIAESPRLKLLLQPPVDSQRRRSGHRAAHIQ